MYMIHDCQGWPAAAVIILLQYMFLFNSNDVLPFLYLILMLLVYVAVIMRGLLSVIVGVYLAGMRKKEEVVDRVCKF